MSTSLLLLLLIGPPEAAPTNGPTPASDGSTTGAPNEVEIQPAPLLDAEPPPTPEPEVPEVREPVPPPVAEPVAPELIVEQPAPPAEPVEERPIIVVKALLGIIGLLVLAFLGGHPRVRKLEAQLGISRVVAAGFPFLALGLLAASSQVGVLSGTVLDHLRPLLHLGLGWIGLTLGIRIEFARMNDLPRGTFSVVAIGTGLPAALIAISTSLVLLGERVATGQQLVDPIVVRDALILGVAGSMAADNETLRYGARKASEYARSRLLAIASLDELAGVVGLAFLGAYFRPTGALVSWQLPNTAWLFVTFGLAFVVGLVVYATLRLPSTGAESVALLLGSVAFTAGLASELHLSPIVVCFVVGVLLANFPGSYQRRLRDVLVRLESPIYFLFLLVAGALWAPSLLGLATMGILLVGRFGGRWVAGRIAYRGAALPRETRRSLVLAPMGSLPIAIAVNAALFYPDGHVSSFLTAAIGGTILTELLLQALWRIEDSKEGG